jgi:hypothetical protein
MTSVLAGLAAVAVRLGIASPQASAGDAARAVRSWLEADGQSCLVVFDNVADPGELRPFLPAASRSRVVITTTGQVTTGPGTVVPVGVFSEAEAEAFLAGRSGRDDAPGALEVARELGLLPLALAQAGAVIAAQRLSYEVYLERLRSLPVREYLTPAQGEPYPRGVAEAVLLSLDAVTAADEAGLCREALDVVSLLSAGGVRRLLLYAAGEAEVFAAPDAAEGAVEERAVDEALGLLAGGSLLAFSGDGDAVIAHRLVMRVVRERRAHEGTLAELGLRVCDLLDMIAALVGDPRRNREAAREVIGHVTALHEHLAPYLGSADGELAEALLDMRGWALGRMNELGDSPAQVVELGEALVADLEQLLDADHPTTLIARNSLASA